MYLSTAFRRSLNLRWHYYTTYRRPLVLRRDLPDRGPTTTTRIMRSTVNEINTPASTANIGEIRLSRYPLLLKAILITSPSYLLRGSIAVAFALRVTYTVRTRVNRRIEKDSYVTRVRRPTRSVRHNRTPVRAARFMDTCPSDSLSNYLV